MTGRQSSPAPSRIRVFCTARLCRRRRRSWESTCLVQCKVPPRRIEEEQLGDRRSEHVDRTLRSLWVFLETFAQLGTAGHVWKQQGEKKERGTSGIFYHGLARAWP